MHTLKNWSAKRSGAAITVSGENEQGQRVKLSVAKIDGPRRGRMCSPASSLAVMRDGTPVALI